MLVSDIETALLTIRALGRCGIADDVDADGFSSHTTEVIWIAEHAWSYGFRKDVEAVYYY